MIIGWYNRNSHCRAGMQSYLHIYLLHIVSKSQYPSHNHAMKCRVINSNVQILYWNRDGGTVELKTSERNKYIKMSTLSLICYAITVFVMLSRSSSPLESFIYPTDAQINCSKNVKKFTLKFTWEVLLHVSVFHNHHHGATTCALMKL